jgi:hypothetical protein
MPRQDAEVEKKEKSEVGSGVVPKAKDFRLRLRRDYMARQGAEVGFF